MPLAVVKPGSGHGSEVQPIKIELAAGPTLLRPPCPSDTSVFHEAIMESTERLAPWMSWCHDHYAYEDSEQFLSQREADWEAGSHYCFGIWRRENGRFLGCVGLNMVNYEHRFANLGYWVRTSESGKGIAAAAAKRIARFGLETLRLNRIEIVTAVTNLPSQRVAQKTGAQREGILRRRLFLRNQVHDAVMFSIVPTDLPPLDPPSK